MRVPRRWPEVAVEGCRNRARRDAGWRALAGEFIEQEHEGGGRPAGDALHADLAGAVTGQVAGALAPGQLIGHWCGRRLGQSWCRTPRSPAKPQQLGDGGMKTSSARAATIARCLSWVPAWCMEQTGCSASDANLRATVSRSDSRSWA